MSLQDRGLKQAFACLLVVAAAGQASAQVGERPSAPADPPGPQFVQRFSADPVLRLLIYDAVQRDLKLTDKQKVRLKAINALIEQKRKELDAHPGIPTGRAVA